MSNNWRNYVRLSLMGAAVIIASVIALKGSMETATAAPQAAGVEVGPDRNQEANPGENVRYSHILTNTGTTTDTFSLEVFSSQSWPVALLAENYPTETLALPLEIGAFLTASFQVSLTVPLDVADVVEVTTVTATSQLDPVVRDTTVDLTTVPPRRIYLPMVLARWPPLPDAPTLYPIDNSDGDGSYTVSWSTAYLATSYSLQEDDNADFSSPTTHDVGPATSWSAQMQPEGLYYYRVKASNAWGDSAWSNVESVLVGGSTACIPDPPGESSNIDDAIKVCPGQVVTGVVDQNDFDDVFKIECKKDQRLQLTLTGPNPDADLYVFAPNATDVSLDEAVDWSNEYDTSNEYINYPIPYDGVWYIDVYAFEGSINYRLEIDLLGAARASEGR